jgi:hypothetical protein
MRIFGQLLLVDKQKVTYLYKTTSKEFEFLHKSYATAVAVETIDIFRLRTRTSKTTSKWRVVPMYGYATPF